MLHKEMKRKISVTTGTRAEYGIMRSVLEAIAKSKKLELHLIVTGMHLSKKYGMTINEIIKDGFRIYSSFDMLSKEDSNYSMSKALGEGIVSFTKIFYKLKPDINLILGDRDEMLASALAAYHLNIPNAHIHGGDKSQGGIDEYNRHAITKISNIHFAATSRSKERILKMGENPKFVFHTGSPSIDEIIKKPITLKKSLEKKYGINLNGKDILLIQHPVTTQTRQSGKQIMNTLKAIVKIGENTIAIAPNSDPGNGLIFKHLRTFSKKYDFIKMYNTLPRNDFLGLLKNCGALVGNSSSGMIEASYFDTPVVNIGIRQKGREKGSNVIEVEDSINSIYSGILRAFKKHKKFHKGNLYGKGNAAAKIVKHLEKIKLDEELINKQIFY